MFCTECSVLSVLYSVFCTVYHSGATTVEDEDVALFENTACVDNAAGKGNGKGKGNTVGEHSVQIFAISPVKI